MNSNHLNAEGSAYKIENTEEIKSEKKESISEKYLAVETNTKTSESKEPSPTKIDLVKRNYEKYSQVYRNDRIIGRGPYCEVRQVNHLSTNQKRAVKIFIKNNYSTEYYNRFMQEIEILKDLRHPSIIQLYEYF